MTGLYSPVTHHPVALAASADGRIHLAVIGPGCQPFVGGLRVATGTRSIGQSRGEPSALLTLSRLVAALRRHSGQAIGRGS
jgi:hypothetical protein